MGNKILDALSVADARGELLGFGPSARRSLTAKVGGKKKEVPDDFFDDDDDDDDDDGGDPDSGAVEAVDP